MPSELISRFKRPTPQDSRYAARLQEELRIIEKHGFTQSFIQVADILDMTQDIPHLTRGSAGSSLVCYLMGISDIDPIAYNISHVRFMHDLRQDIPDIDIDFPYHRRDEVFKRVFYRYGDRCARISNHLYYRDRSALREAARQHGVKGRIPRNYETNDPGILKRASELLNTQKGYSLHCGGLVIFNDPIHKELKLKDQQLLWDKNDVERLGHFKIDLLSNRALAQLMEIDQRPLTSYPERDEATASLFQTGNVLGITQGESPAARKLARALQVQCRNDIIISLGLIRPAAASRGGKAQFLRDWDEFRRSEKMVFEDDATQLIQTLLNCSEPEADVYRRAFAKGLPEKMAEFGQRLGNHPSRDTILQDLGQFSAYSFCKAHAVSYGRLVWALAWQKAHHPQEFWLSTLNHAQSLYRSWVHIEEAKKAGWKVTLGKRPFEPDKDVLVATGKRPLIRLTQTEQYLKYGYWTEPQFLPGFEIKRLPNKTRIHIRGLIATYRHFSNSEEEVTFITLGLSSGEYMDVTVPGYLNCHDYDIFEGDGYEKVSFKSPFVEVQSGRLLKLS